MDDGEGIAREYHDEAIASEETSRRSNSHGHRQGSHDHHLVVSLFFVVFYLRICVLWQCLSQEQGESEINSALYWSVENNERYHLLNS